MQVLLKIVLTLIKMDVGYGSCISVCSDMEDVPPPNYQDMLIVMKHAYESCRRKHIPIGIAPNIEVSLIVQPDDGRYLVPRNLNFYINEGLLRLKKFAANKTIFKKELTPHAVLTDETDLSSYKIAWSDHTPYSSLATGITKSETTRISQ